MEKVVKIIIALMFIGSVNAYAQLEGMTQYERGRYDLANTALTKIMEVCGVQEQLFLTVNITDALKDCEDVYEEVLLIENFVIKTCNLADTFKTEAEYMSLSSDLSSLYNADLLNSWRKTGMWYKYERDKLELTKTEQDTFRELRRKKERIARKSGYGPVLENIAKSFADWAQRGEYEKTSQYEERMKTKAVHAFDSLCFIKANDAWHDHVNARWGEGYDADSETRVIELYYKKRTNEGKYEDIASVKGQLPLTPEEHKEFQYRIDRLFGRSYALDLCIINGKIFPSSACIMGNNVNFAETGNFAVEADSILHKYPDVAKYLAGHTFVYSDFIRNKISVYEFARRIASICKVMRVMGLSDPSNERVYIKSFGDIPTRYKGGDLYIGKGNFYCFSNHQAEELTKDVLDAIFVDNRHKCVKPWQEGLFSISYEDFMDYLSKYLQLENYDAIKELVRDQIVAFASSITETELYDYSFLANSPLYWLLCIDEDWNEAFTENCVSIKKNKKKMSKRLDKSGYSSIISFDEFYVAWLYCLKASQN